MLCYIFLHFCLISFWIQFCHSRCLSKFQNVFRNYLSAIEQVSSSIMVKDNLNVMHVAKQEFLHCDSNEKKLALKINILIETLKNGDEVSYKINDTKA